MKLRRKEHSIQCLGMAIALGIGDAFGHCTREHGYRHCFWNKYRFAFGVNPDAQNQKKD